MGDFSPDWLGLREPVDARARSAPLTQRLAAWLSGSSHRSGGPSAPLTVLDLGCGTGANLRYLAPRLAEHLPGHQRWACLDRDRDLLAALPHRTGDWAAGRGMATCPVPGPVRECGEQFPHRTGDWAAGRGMATCAQGTGLRVQSANVVWDVQTLAMDLGKGAGALPTEQASLVTASALLDLVSEAWLDGLLAACARVSVPLLLALTYDGRVTMAPEHPLDGAVIGLVNAHQRRDKGMGPALGPRAPARLEHLGRRRGLVVEMDDSSWRLGPADVEMQNALVDGWAAAAREQTSEAQAGKRPGCSHPSVARGTACEHRRRPLTDADRPPGRLSAPSPTLWGGRPNRCASRSPARATGGALEWQPSATLVR
jgi:SAM-dependent methyltransferase